jgi:hypothetical protein
MRLHAALLATVLLGGLSSAALADEVKNASKPLEGAAGAPRPQKKTQSSTFAPQAQLFVEQKDAPANSKTSLRLESITRLSAKSKD